MISNVFKEIVYREFMKSTKKEVARKKSTKSSPPVPIISLTDEELKLLKATNKTGRFNINNYSDMFKIPRSTTRSRLKKLDRIGLISYEFADVKIIKTGNIYLENVQELNKNASRVVARKQAKRGELSAHWHKFSFKIINRKQFREERLNFLNCSWKENKGMKNWNELIIYFNDATIIIKPKTLILELKDMVEKDTSEVNSKCLRRMMEYSELLNSIGIKLGQIVIERGHWARVDSLLADIIYKKIGNKYYLLDENGKKIFHIDFSADETGRRKKEDETHDKVARENLDYNIDQQLNDKYNFDKINSNEKGIKDHNQVTDRAIRTLGQYDKQISLHLSVEQRKLILAEKQINQVNIQIQQSKDQNKLFGEIRDYLKK